MNEVECESYFPELENRVPVNSSKWGLLNVYFGKCPNVITGYQWKYAYFDGFKMKTISSYDLTKLRQKVLSKGLPWVITDNKSAIDAYKLNHRLREKHDEYKKNIRGTRTKSGVKYVYKYKDSRARRGFYWIYLVYNDELSERQTYSSNRLLKLKDKLEHEGLKWIITNQELYEELLKEEEKL